MEILFCEHCNARQPVDWQAGDLCVACGKLARSEIRCGWCARMTPEGAFCRHCGFELADPLFYGATRMLKAEGVDKFALNERMKTLTGAHKAHFENMYNQQLAVMNEHIDDALFCEGFLWGEYHNQLAQALLELLPLSAEQIEGYRLNRPFFDSDQARLKYLSSHSPVFHLREMASIALVLIEDDPYEPISALIGRTFDNPLLKNEILQLIGHWRGRLDAYPEEQIDAFQLLAEQQLEGPFGFWATATLVKVFEQLGRTVEPKHLRRLENGLTSSNPDLSLSAAILLEDEQALYQYRGPGTVYATYILCMLGSPLMADVIKRSSREQVSEIVSFMREDSPPISTAAKYALLSTLPEHQTDSRLFEDILDILLDSDHREAEVLNELAREARRRGSSEILLNLLVAAEADFDGKKINEIMDSLASMPIHCAQLPMLNSAAEKGVFNQNLIRHLSTLFAAWSPAAGIDDNDRSGIFTIYSAQLKFKEEGAAPWIACLLSPWRTEITEPAAATSRHVEIVEACWDDIGDYIVSCADGNGETVRQWIAAISRILVGYYRHPTQFGRSNLSIPSFYMQMAQKAAFGFEIYKTLWGLIFQEDNLPLSETMANWMVDYFDLSNNAPTYRIPNQDREYRFGPMNEHWVSHFFAAKDDCLGQLNAIITTSRFGRLNDWLIGAWDKHDPAWLVKFAHSKHQLLPLLHSLSGFKGDRNGYHSREAARILKQTCTGLLDTEQAGYYAKSLLDIYAGADDNQYAHFYGLDGSIARKIAGYLDTLANEKASSFHSTVIDTLDMRIRRNDWSFTHMKYCLPLVEMLETAAEKGLLDDEGIQKVDKAAQYIRVHNEGEFDEILNRCHRITAPGRS
jgi:hypothetical protein